MAFGPINSNVKVVLDNSKKFFEALEELTSKSVFVGVPSTQVKRDQIPNEPAPPNNAVIAYIMENGDPARNIPARPFLVPGIKDVQPEIVVRLKAISKAAMASDIGQIKSLRMQLGIFAQRAVQQKITDGPFQPLSDVTLRARAARGRKGAKKELARRALGLVPSTAFARPLIDTGQLRRSINFVVGPNVNRAKSIQELTGRFFTGYK